MVKICRFAIVAHSKQRIFFAMFDFELDFRKHRKGFKITVRKHFQFVSCGLISDVCFVCTELKYYPESNYSAELSEKQIRCTCEK